MLPFNAGPFTDQSKTELGKKLWIFLNTKEALACFDTTTFLSRPALEGFQPQLLGEFGSEVWSDRCKQTVGRMVRQIMENRGYTLDRSGVRTKAKVIFTSAARYKKLA